MEIIGIALDDSDIDGLTKKELRACLRLYKHLYDLQLDYVTELTIRLAGIKK